VLRRKYSNFDKIVYLTRRVPIIIQKNSARTIIYPNVDSNLMDATNEILNKDLEIYGLCDKQLACTTCSVHILSKYALLPSPSEEELDILYSLKDYRIKYSTFS